METKDLPIEVQIEAVLFWKAEPMSKKDLARLLKCPTTRIDEGLKTLEEKLSCRGVKLIFKEDQVSIGTAPEMSSVIENLLKEELAKDLGKAGLETLTIILYRGPIGRREIDYVRGVNSNFIIRNLMIRGLVERVPNEKDQRSFLYKPTFELMSFLGVSKIEDLPDYEVVKKELELFKAELEEKSIDRGGETGENTPDGE